MNVSRPRQAARPAAPSGTVASTPDALDRLRGRLMRQSLTDLLDKVRGARQALPHLAALETALDHQGPAVLHGLSRPVLIKVCSQLSGLPLPVDDPPLHDLLKRLMTALDAAHATAAASLTRTRAAHDLSDLMTEDKLLVSEASYTDFAAASEEFAATPPRQP